ncbi:MAG: hypothetical protein NC084_05480 [Bacteroides sp.]|nr:hypothetical protein [Eubacterium sp.]MCM1418029.1 hypothetical protein [Roseburia sp.]MCM1462148.1 hypothetical protein [Bacteroides sp.]
MPQRDKEDRFGFHITGYFRCSREQERIELAAAYVGIVLLLTVNLAILVIRVILLYPTIGGENRAEALLLALLTALPPLLIFSGAEYLLFRLFRGRVFEGVLYYYFADETIFVFRCPARRLNFSVRYEEVAAVEYYKRHTFLLPRGYTVILETTDGKRRRFPCISYEKTDRPFLEKPAAFLLLEERIDEMRRTHGRELAERFDWSKYNEDD